jgi:hypothetical protein
VATGDPNRNCINDPPQANPQANNNLISQNTLNDNGNIFGGVIPGVGFLAADLTYFDLIEGSSGNCFEKNKPDGFTFVSSDGQLPTDGC